MKRDPYKHKERYLKWRKNVGKAIPGVTKANSQLILKYLDDMEIGSNISNLNRKGSRSYIRLNTLREKTIFFAKKFEEIYGLNCVTDITEEQLCGFFSDMKKGKIKRLDGKPYKSISDFVKVFKAFWHWHQKVNKKNGNGISDITEDLDSRQEKPKWVYLTEEQVRSLCNQAKFEYKVLFMFLFDTGIRSPTELMNVKVSDLYNGYKELNIRDEISKTFGRKIKLMLCSTLLREYIKEKELTENDYLFEITPSAVNRYLKTLAEKVLGDSNSPAGEKYSALTMYDLRHNSACYWLPRYKSESALKYRFGWKGSEFIHYYTEFLGMKDTISEEDILLEEEQRELKKELKKSEMEKGVMQERMDHMENQMKQILELVNEMGGKVKG
jgi:hypothetical protein